MSAEEAQSYAVENGLIYWETSAKTNVNVAEVRAAGSAQTGYRLDAEDAIGTSEAHVSEYTVFCWCAKPMGKPTGAASCDNSSRHGRDLCAMLPCQALHERLQRWCCAL